MAVSEINDSGCWPSKSINWSSWPNGHQRHWQANCQRDVPRCA